MVDRRQTVPRVPRQIGICITGAALVEAPFGPWICVVVSSGKGYYIEGAWIVGYYVHLYQREVQLRFEKVALRMQGRAHRRDFSHWYEVRWWARHFGGLAYGLHADFERCTLVFFGDWCGWGPLVIQGPGKKLILGEYISRDAGVSGSSAGVWRWSGPRPQDFSHPSLRGGTDNKAAESLAAKGLTTKFPLVIVLMEYLAICEQRRVRCQLEWTPQRNECWGRWFDQSGVWHMDLEKRIDILGSSWNFPWSICWWGYGVVFKKETWDRAQPSIRAATEICKIKVVMTDSFRYNGDRSSSSTFLSAHWILHPNLWQCISNFDMDFYVLKLAHPSTRQSGCCLVRVIARVFHLLVEVCRIWRFIYFTFFGVCLAWVPRLVFCSVPARFGKKGNDSRFFFPRCPEFRDHMYSTCM